MQEKHVADNNVNLLFRGRNVLEQTDLVLDDGAHLKLRSGDIVALSPEQATWLMGQRPYQPDLLGPACMVDLGIVHRRPGHPAEAGAPFLQHLLAGGRWHGSFARVLSGLCRLLEELLVQLAETASGAQVAVAPIGLRCPR